MARLIGPSEASREVKTIVSGSGVTKGLFKSKANRPATFYLDKAATQLPDILTEGGAPIAGSTVTIDAYSMLPLIQFPDGVDTLYVVIDGGPAWPVYAREDDRFDALNTAVQAAQSASTGALSKSSNLSDLASAATARTNLGLGSAATKSVGTASADVAAGDAPATAQAAAISAAATDATTKAGAAQAAAVSAAATDATTKANAAQAVAVQRANHTGTQSADTLTDGTTNKAFLATERTKLAGIATGATANASDAQLRDRSTHTGTQATSTVTGLDAALAAKTDTSRTISTTAPLAGGGDLSANRTLTVADAAAGAKGVVQLAGDLTGTAASPAIAAGAVTFAKTAAGLGARLYRDATGEVLAGDPFYGTPGTRAALINALDDAEALGKHSIVRLKPGIVFDVGNGLSLSGYSVQLRGAGGSRKSATAATTIKASTQTGPVLDFTGWLTPGSFTGHVTHEGFRVQGSGLADATKANTGITIDYLDSTTFRDIAIENTGGPCLKSTSVVPGVANYLNDFERIICVVPVGCNANDVPYMHLIAQNGNRWRSIGFRALGTNAERQCGVSGALVVTDDGTFSSESNLFDGCWFESQHIPDGGTLVNFRAFNNIMRDTQMFDIRKISGATNTSYYRLTNSAANGGSQLLGVIPGGLRSSTDPDMGVDLQGSGHRVEGSKGDGTNNVVLSSGAGYNYVHLKGKNRGVLGVGIVDSSGQNTNHLIDEANLTATIPANFTAVGGAGSGSAPVTTAFSASASVQSFTVPSWAKLVRIRGQAAGGGSGSGARQPDGTGAGGGGSGGGGAAFDLTFAATDVTATLLIDVGLAGTSGAAVTTDSTNGNPGTAGGDVRVRDSTGTITYARATGGGLGGGGTSTAGGTAGSAGVGQFGGAAGVVGSFSAAAANGNTAAGGPSGGPGGGISAANVAQNAGLGGYSTAGSSFALTAVTANGTSVNPSGTARGGTAGGGGSAGSGTAAGAVAGSNGGNAGNYGASGGGGGAARNGNNSGAGGVSAPGLLTITVS